MFGDINNILVYHENMVPTSKDVPNVGMVGSPESNCTKEAISIFA